MKLGHIETTLSALGPIIDRLACLAVAHQHGDITGREYVKLRTLNHWTYDAAQTELARS